MPDRGGNTPSHHPSSPSPFVPQVTRIVGWGLHVLRAGWSQTEKAAFLLKLSGTQKIEPMEGRSSSISCQVAVGGAGGQHCRDLASSVC